MLKYCPLLFFVFISTVGQAEEAKQKNVDPQSAFRAGDFATALKYFRQLRLQETDPEVRLRLQWNIGRSLEKLGRIEEALKNFRAYKTMIKDSVRLARCEAKIKELLRLRQGAIAVSCDQRHATVSIDGTGGDKKACPAIFESIPVGKHIVVGVLANGQTSRVMVSVEPDKTVPAQLIFGVQPVVTKTPKQTKNKSNAWMWYVGGGVAAIAVGTLTYFLVNQGNSSSRHRTQLCFDGQCP